MKIVYIGPFDYMFGTEEHIAHALGALGHDVLRVRDSKGATIDHHAAGTKSSDLLLFQSTGWPTRATDVWRQVEANGCLTASIHLDLYAGLKRQSLIDADPFWRTGTVFTADGGSDEFFALHGVNHRWFPPAVAHNETQEGQWRDEYDHDVVFVGSGAYHGEWPWRAQLIRLLAKKYGTRFKHYDHHPPIRGNDLNDLYATARVVVGDSLALPGHRNYFSDRYFETLGRGGFLIGPNVPGIEDFFTDGEHLALYDIGDADGLVDKIDWFLGHQAEARQIAQCGQAHVRAHHTYVHRAEQMLATLGLTVSA